MQAIVHETYGTPDILQLKEVPEPKLEADDLRVKVHAASVNSWDWDLLRGQFINRLIFKGLTRPKIKILGADVAGEVVEVGQASTLFKKGDRVCGDLSANGWGGYAEYVCAPGTVWTKIPEAVSFVDAAALPQAGVMALQSLRDKRKIGPGDKVLINGAGGGVGTYCIQLAKNLGAEVTAVDSSQKLSLMQSVGADHVIDYKQVDFTKNGQQYDLLVDVVSNRSVFEYKPSLRPGGVFLMVGGEMPSIMQTAFIGPLLSRKGFQFGLLMHEPNKHLPELLKMLEDGKIRSVIDGPYDLADTAKAIQRIGDGAAMGKVVIKVV